MIPLDQQDPFGRLTIPGARALLPERRVRRWTKARVSFFHHVKNGIHDPLTFFQLLEELANVRPNQRFTAAEFAQHLNEHKEMFIWDSVVVGRILNDLVESWNDANPSKQHQPLVTERHWSGREYATTDHPAARAVLANLLDDLAILGERYQAAARAGQPLSRLSSPLSACSSLGLQLEAVG